MKKLFLSSVAISFLLIGCGGGSGSSNETISYNLKEVKVVDGYVIGAKVCDEEGICAITSADGIARANFHDNSILTSVGGVIDTNFNGIADSDEPTAPTMKSNTDLISPITTLVVEGIDINKLSSITGLTKEELLYEDPFETNNVKLVKLFNAFYPLLKENTTSKFISLVNSLNNSNNSALPPIGGSSISNVNIFTLVKISLSKPEDIAFVQKVENITSTDAKTLAETLDKYKISLEQGTFTYVSNMTTTTENTGTMTTSMSTTPTTAATSMSTSIQNATGNSALPDINNPTNFTVLATSSSSSSSLPNLNTNVVTNIPTNSAYNPSYQPVPPIYQVHLDSLNQFVTLDKISDTEYKFKNTLFINVNTKEFNVSTLFDINASYVFQSLKFSPDGNLKGTSKIILLDKNDSSNAKINITGVIYKVSEQNMTQADFTNITYEVNQTTDNNYTGSLDAGTYTGFDINLSKAYRGLDEKEYNQTNHIYDFIVEYNVSGKILTLKGTYEVVDLVVPKITLNQNYIIGETNKDINVSIGTSAVPSVPCSLSGVSGLSCEVNGSGNIFITGTVPDSVGVKVATITLNNQGITDSRDIYVEIVKPITTQVVVDWNLTPSADGNYSGYHIAMNLSGSLDCNTTDVNTSVTDVPTGSPENNVTVYLFNSPTDTSNYIIFIFDANVYGPNDAFRITRKDGKSVTFRVGDIDSSNNAFSFK